MLTVANNNAVKMVVPTATTCPSSCPAPRARADAAVAADDDLAAAAADDDNGADASDAAAQPVF